MKGYKKTLYIISIIIGVLASFYLLNLLNETYPHNIIHRIIDGIKIVLVPMLIALMITYLTNPFTTRMMNHKVPKMLAVIITMVVSIGIIVGLLVFVVIFMIEEGNNIYDSIISSTFLVDIETWFISNNLEEVYNFLYDAVKNMDSSRFASTFGNILTTVFSTVTTIVLVPVFLWFFLSEKDRIFMAINRVLPLSWQEHIGYIGSESNVAVVAYFKSKILSMLFLFTAFLIVFFLMGIPIGYALFFAVIIGFFDLVPYLGPILGLMLPFVYFFSNGTVTILWLDQLTVNAFWGSIILLGVNIVLQFTQNNIVIPKLAGDAMNINPLLILVAMLFFGSILGVWGIVFAIPLVGIGVIVLDYIKAEDKAKKRKERTKI